jgi:hypothetical protein
MKNLYTIILLLISTIAVYSQNQVTINTTKVCMNEDDVYIQNNNSFKFNYNNSTDLVITWDNGSIDTFIKDSTQTTKIGRTKDGYETQTNIYRKRINSHMYMVQLVNSPQPVVLMAPVDKDYVLLYQ